MKLPNKLFTYQESILSKLPIILTAIINNDDMDIYNLYKKVENNFINLYEFVEAVECLYALGKIEYDAEFRGIKYVI